MRTTIVLIGLFLPALADGQVPSPGASPSNDVKRELERQRRELDQLNELYGERIRELEARLWNLESEQERQREEDELDELLRLAEAAGPPPVERPSVAPSILNPEISVTPDFVGRIESVNNDTGDVFGEIFKEKNAFDLREVEVLFRAPVSPEADAVATFTVGEEESTFEEAYIQFHSLPWGLQGKVGKFRLDFGRINAVHTHNLPQVDRPLVTQLLFGAEGTASPGISASKVLYASDTSGLLPNHSEIVVQAINAGNEEAPLFGEEPDSHAALNAHWKNFWQIDEYQDFEGGVSFLSTGSNKSGSSDSSTVLGTDLTYRWNDPEPGSHRSWLVQSEVIGSSVDTDDGSVDALGAYLMAQRQFDPRWYGGLRLDSAESPFHDDANVWGVVPYVTYYVNEFLRLRMQYHYYDGDDGDGNDATSHGVSMQMSWTFGAHPPEPYWVNR